MAISVKSVYRRILPKLSGETLQGLESLGTDANILDRMTQEIKEPVELGIQVGVAIDGGNLFRGAGLAKAGMNRVVSNHMGMLVMVINGPAVCDVLHRAYVNACLVSAIPLSGVCDNYSQAEAISLPRNNRAVILSAGTGNPFFTIDSTACLRGVEIEAGVTPKATKVDGVFTTGSAKNPSAIMYNQPTYSEALDKELKVMNLAAFTLTRDHKLPIRVFNINEPSALRCVIMDKREGTLIME